MNFCAIIAEFNPFHNGHEYLIKRAKQLDMPLLCLQSGNFVQRGEMAIVDKYTRAKCAISAGADIVLELPVVYSLSSAEIFAKGAIKILKALGCSHLVVGVTHTNLDDYLDIAKIKNTNLKSAIASELEKGENYSKTLINILKTKCPNSEKIFVDASNILALEYIDQIIKQKANISVVLVPRTDGGYNSESTNMQFANASTIRSLISQNKSCDKFVPIYAQNQFKNALDPHSLDNILLYNLRKTPPEMLSNYYDYREGLPYLISSSAQNCASLSDAISAASCKRYRTARIKKLCIYPTLNITKDNFNKILNGRPVCKLLAIKNDKKQFISHFNKPYARIIVSKNDYKSLSKAQFLSAQIDLSASNLYAIASHNPHNNDIKTGTLFIK